MGIESPSLEYGDRLPIRTAKMHILVHPGYLMDNPTGRDKQQLAQAEMLPEKYAKLAKNLPANEIMIILIHYATGQFRDDYKAGKAYVKNIQALRGELRGLNQGIVLTSETVPFGGMDKVHDTEALAKIKEIAENRGYTIDPGTVVDIFGEEYDQCVHEALAGINNTGFFHKGNVRILKELTDRAGEQ